MKTYAIVVVMFVVGLVAIRISQGQDQPATGEEAGEDLSAHVAEVLSVAPPVGEQLTHSEDEWRASLTEDQFEVLRNEGTERPFTGEYWDNHEHGIYRCAGCGAPLFSSDTKFESGTGWPSYHTPIEVGRVTENVDSTYGMVRTEIECARCGGHLGHVFNDGPEPTGLRYCVNSLSLTFDAVE